MFEFLFKRNETAPAEPAAPAVSAPQAEALRRRARTLAEDALASSDAADEQALADFIAGCDDAEARRIAAEAVQTRPILMQVRQAMLHTDRRVARLMHVRLEQLDRQERLAAGAAQCIEQARTLLDAPVPGVTQVAELDRAWHALAQSGETVPAPLAQRFQRKFDALSARLRAQADLQRAVLDALRAATESVADGDALAALLRSAEAPSLPRKLVAEAERVCAEATLRKNAPPPVPEAVAVAAAVAPVPVVPPKARPVRAAPEDDAAYAAALADMESALDQGLLQQAEKVDKRLRELTAQPRHAARLAQLRAELARLSAWARWGGNVSREELAKAAEDLAAQPHEARELARRIAALRAHWKELDAHAGPAPKALWERFDNACGTAYAPAAAHFAQQAQVRKDNAAAALALLAQVEQAQASVRDVKTVAAFVQQCEAAWRRLGPVDRKEKKTLDARFETALAALRAPLDEARRTETARREGLIAQVEALQAADRGALDRLKQLQASWQDGARSLPLARREEQALWQRFRAACDAVFAQRKQAAGEADGVRRAALMAGEALCARLEQAGADADAVLRDVRQQWQALGELPRAQAAKLEQRYRNAVAALEQRRADVKSARLQSLRKTADDRLALCAALDAALVSDGGIDADDWRAHWAALDGKPDAAMARRFEGALAAAASGRDAYVAQLRAGAARFAHDLLRLEIMAGQPSPAEHQAARLQVQVEVLRQSLRDGQGAASAVSLRDALYAMPCADADATARLIAASAALGRSGAA
jgi:hypothetical protein